MILVVSAASLVLAAPGFENSKTKRASGFQCTPHTLFPKDDLEYLLIGLKQGSVSMSLALSLDPGSSLESSEPITYGPTHLQSRPYAMLA